MATLLFANNAQTSLAGAITSTALVVNLSAGTGVLFPQPSAGEYFVASFTDLATNLQTEIVWVTNITGDVATIQRGQEGTTPQAWGAGDLFGALVTAGMLDAFVQQNQLVQVTSNVFVGTDTGAVNSMVIATTQTLTSLTFGIEIDVIPTATNTSTAVANVNAIGPGPIIRSDGTPLLPGDYIAGVPVKLIWNGTAFNLFQVPYQVQFKGKTRAVSSTPLAMAASDIGSAVTLNAATGVQAVTLPTTTGLPVGATVLITRTGSGTATIGSFGAAANINNGSATLASTITINAGENALFTWDGTTWTASGTFMARYVVASLGQQLTSNGYQRFPGGLILQWGSQNISRGEGTYTVTFPITFPNAALNLTGGILNSSANGATGWTFQEISKSASGFSWYQQKVGATSNPSGYSWFAIGY